MTSGYTAAVNVLSFGAMESHGDACGRCFQITPTSDPYSPDYEGSMGNTIVVRVTDLCPFSSAGTEGWCDQTLSEPLNAYKMPMQCVFVFLPLGPWDSENKINRSFDLCADSDSGAAAAFFPEGRGAMLGEYKEVSCTEWKGGEGSSLWGGSCMAPIGTSLWPKVSCGNEGTKHPLFSLVCAVMQFWLTCALRIPTTSEAGLRTERKKTEPM